eukprot:Skav205425  [mRNA]  locus=scaffold582:407623:422267:- [translate_table: standard]
MQPWNCKCLQALRCIIATGSVRLCHVTGATLEGMQCTVALRAREAPQAREQAPAPAAVAPTSPKVEQAENVDPDKERAVELFRGFLSNGRGDAQNWRKNDLRLINTFVVPWNLGITKREMEGELGTNEKNDGWLFGPEARIDWAHPVLALDELEQLVQQAPEQRLGSAPPVKRCGTGDLPRKAKEENGPRRSDAGWWAADRKEAKALAKKEYGHREASCLRIWQIVKDAIALLCRIHSNQELCNAIQQARCQLQDYDVVKDDEWMFLVPKALNLAAIELNPTIAVSDDESDLEEPAAKRQCVSPTWEFEAMEVESPHVERFQFLEDHVGYVHCPQAAALSLASCVLDPPPVEDAIPAQLLHAQGIWVVGFFATGRPKVCDVIRHVLPHACGDHFERLWLNNRVACLSTKPSPVDYMSLVFQPVTFVRLIRATFLHDVVSVAVDVTWKLCDLAASVASVAKVLVTQINFHHLHTNLDLQSFVLAHDLLEFDCELAPQPAETWRPNQQETVMLQRPVVDHTM